MSGGLKLRFAAGRSVAWIGCERTISAGHRHRDARPAAPV